MFALSRFNYKLTEVTLMSKKVWVTGNMHKYTAKDLGARAPNSR